MPSKSGIDVAVMMVAVAAFACGTITLVMAAMAHLTGWRKLAAAFPVQPPAGGAPGGLTSLGFYTLGNYNNCVLWKADDDYLHLRLMPPFSWMSHPPMSIPWAAVDVVQATPRWGTSRIKVMEIPIKVEPKLIARELALRAELDAGSGTLD